MQCPSKQISRFERETVATVKQMCSVSDEQSDFSSQKRMNHAYERHAEKCFGMKENRNKENLQKFEVKARKFIESPGTEKKNGSYRYETPAYFYKEKDGNLLAIVNATDNFLLL